MNQHTLHEIANEMLNQLRKETQDDYYTELFWAHYRATRKELQHETAINRLALAITIGEFAKSFSALPRRRRNQIAKNFRRWPVVHHLIKNGPRPRPPSTT